MKLIRMFIIFDTIHTMDIGIPVSKCVFILNKEG